MWRFLTMFVLLNTAWLRTGEPALIEHHDYGSYLIDRYLETYVLEQVIAYEVLLETAPLSSYMMQERLVAGYPVDSGFISVEVELPRYKDRGRILEASSWAFEPPPHSEPARYQHEKLVEPVQEMCGEVACDYYASYYRMYDLMPAALVEGYLNTFYFLFDTVENGGTVAASWRYYLGTCSRSPDLCDRENVPGFNSRTTVKWQAEFELEFGVGVEVIYEPFTSVPEPGSASLVVIAMSIACAAFARRRTSATHTHR